MNNFCKNCGKKIDGKECDCTKEIEKKAISKEEKIGEKVENRFEVEGVEKNVDNKNNASFSTTKKSSNGGVILIVMLLLALALLGDILIVNFIKENVFDYSDFEDETVPYDEIVDDFLYDSNYEDNVKDNVEDNVEDKNQDTFIEDAKIQYYESPFYNFNTYQYNLLNIDGSNLNLNFITDSTGDTIDTYGTLDNYSDSEYDLNLTIKYYDYDYNEIGTCSTSVYVTGDSYMNGKGFLCAISPNDLRVGKTVYDIVYHKVFVDNASSVK